MPLPGNDSSDNGLPARSSRGVAYRWLGVWGLLALATGSLAGTTLPGRELYLSHGCPVCHGNEGRQPSHDTYPVIAGQNRAYLVQQLLDIQSGERANGSTGLMVEVVRDLARPEIEAIADYLASLTWSAAR